MKPNTHPSAPALSPIPSSCTRPFDQISVDLITDLLPCTGFDSVMVVVDHGLSKGVILSPCTKTITAEGVADLFVQKIFSRFGLPSKIISDRGPQFASKFTLELGRLLKYSNSLSTAYHPQTDGQTERMNQELETYLRIYCRKDPYSWVKHLPLAKFTHNHRIHETQKRSPFHLMMGYEPRAIPPSFPSSSIPAAEERIKELQKTREEALACHAIAAKRMADRRFHSTFKPWKCGDKVWLSASHLTVPFPCKKLLLKRYGPFTIKNVLSRLTYTLNLPKTWKVHPTFHATELTSYHENPVHGKNFPEPPPDVIEDSEEYEVESILADKNSRGKRMYLVAWKGYSSAHNSWEPEGNLANAAQILKQYKQSRRQQ